MMRCWTGGVRWIGTIIRNFNSRLERIVDPPLGTRFGVLAFLAGNEADWTLMFRAICAALRVLVF